MLLMKKLSYLDSQYLLKKIIISKSIKEIMTVEKLQLINKNIRK